MSRPRLAVTCLAGLLLALGLLGAATARTQLGSKYGGTLVVGWSEATSLDPTIGGGPAAVDVWLSICERLYEYDSKGQIVPQLAAALPAISKDKLTYTIPLRRGIEFNDGTPFNAQAVVTSLERAITLPASSRASDFAPVDTFTATGADTVVIKLKTRFSLLTGVLATTSGIIMSPAQLAKLGMSFGTNPVCVGPFTFDHRLAGDHVTVIKSPWYYNRGAVHLDKIVYKTMSNPAAAAAALKAGDIHVLGAIEREAVPAIEQTSSVRVLKQRSLGWTGIFINIGNKYGIEKLPYANVGTPLASSAKLRQAFEEALDRQTIIRIVDGGAGVPGCTPISPASPAYDASIKCTRYNPKHAKELVAASGFPSPTVHLLTINSTRFMQMAQVVQAMEKDVGINVVIDIVDSATGGARREDGDFEALLGLYTGGPLTDRNVYQFVASDGDANYSGYSNPRLDLILANSRKATSLAALKTLYHAAFQILVEDRPIIFISHAIRYQGVSASVTGVQFAANGSPVVAFAQYR